MPSYPARHAFFLPAISGLRRLRFIKG